MRGTQSEETRERVLVKAKELFTERGYEEVTMEQLAEASDITEKQLVKHFPSKGELVIELMIDGFSLDENINEKGLSRLDLNQAVADIVNDYIMTRLNSYTVFGKPLFRELMSWSLSLANKKPKLMSKFVQMDFMFVDDLIEFLDQLKAKGMMKEAFDSVQAAEIIYSSLAFEYLVYVYQDHHTKEQLEEGIHKKLHFIFN